MDHSQTSAGKVHKMQRQTGAQQWEEIRNDFTVGTVNMAVFQHKIDALITTVRNVTFQHILT